MRISDWSSDVCSSDLAWLAVALALGVIVFGAFVRLSNAGLSCPDWPTCYGRAAWPTAASDAVDHAATAIRPVEVHKAWREQLHRMIAGALGVLVLVLALLAARTRQHGVLQVVAAAVRSEEHTSELHSLMRNSYAVFSFTKKQLKKTKRYITK